MPAIRGTVTTKDSYGGSPLVVTAPTGLADGDRVDIIIYSESATKPGWSCTGFTEIFYGAPSSAINTTHLWTTISGTPPASFTLSNTTAPTFHNIYCIAWQDAGDTTPVVGTAAMGSSVSPATAITVPGITIPDNGSLWMVVAGERFGTESSATFTQHLNNDLSIFSIAADAGATGTTEIDVTNGFQTYLGYSLNVPPVAAGGATLELPFISASSTLHAPTVTPQAATVALPAIASGSTLHAPTVTAQAATVELPFISATSTLHAPTVTPQAATVALPAIASTSTLHTPTVTAQAATVALPHIASTATLHAPTVSASGATVALPHIDSTTALHAPTVTPQAATVALPSIASTSTLHAPTLAGDGEIVLPHIVATSQPYAPTLTPQAVTVVLPSIASSASIYAPTIIAQPATVALPFIGSTVVLYAPRVYDASNAPVFTSRTLSTLWSDVDRATSWTDVDRSTSWTDPDRSLTWTG